MNPYNCKDRLHGLMLSGEFSDCVFMVENERFNVHRLILSMSSPVFKAMLYGHWATTENIVITDIDADIFRNIIEYIYVDKLNIETVHQACNLLYASKKYMISYLVTQCILFIERETSIDDALQVYNFCINIQEEELTAHIFNYVCKNAKLILWNNLENIDVTILKTILKEDKLNIEEMSLINFVFEWSKQQCTREGVPVTAENRRRILEQEGLLDSLRFLSLGVADIRRLTLDNVLLSEEEVQLIQQNTGSKILLLESRPDSPQTNALCPIRKPRDPIPIKLIYCLRSSIVTTRPLVITEFRNSINVRMKSSKTITVHCLSIPTQSTPEHFEGFAGLYDHCYLENIEISISLADGSAVAVTNFIGSNSYNATVCINLDCPYTFQKDKSYRVTFKWPSLRSNIRYQAVWRSDTTFSSASIVYDEFTDNNDYHNCSFLVGLKYTV